MRFSHAIFIFSASILSITTLYSQSDDEVLQKIKSLSTDTLGVMHTTSILSDVYGPRLMGTPNYYNAALWIKQQLENWQMDNIILQSFDNNHRGWAVENFSVEMTSPTSFPIHAFPLAFTNSTNGHQTGEIVFIEHFEDVYDMDDTDLNQKVILLKGYYSPVSNYFRPMSYRLSDETLTSAIANPDPNDVIIGYHSRRSTSAIFEIRKKIKLERRQFLKFCKAKGVIALIEPSDYPYGILHADGNRTIPSFNHINDIDPIASFVISNEHFGRLTRLKALGYSPKLKVNLKSKFYTEPKFNVNVIAEIKGTDPMLKDEVVIIGAHLDSWHAGTGAVDNASNCAVMMEVMRILKTIGVKPRRTIRLILWGGEEQVFAGSLFYINQSVGHLMSATPKKEHTKISAYLNLDNGAGRIRGIYLMGNTHVRPYFSEFLQPFNGDNTLTLQNANQTDHELFDYHNVPAFQFIQDPLDYINAIHHTNLDLFEYIPKTDQIHNVELVAYLTYRIAQEDTLLPRKQYNSPIPSRTGNVTLSIDGYQDATQIYLTGDFNNWNMFGLPLYRTDSGWEVKIDLPPGKYYYKYIIDGYWSADPKTHKNDLVKDGNGHAGLTVLRVD